MLGYHGCSGCYQCKGLFYFSLIPLSWTVTTLQTATRTAGLLCTRHPSPEGGEKSASLSHGAASCRGHTAGVGPRGPPPGVPVPEALGGDDASFPHQSSGAKCLGAEKGSALFLQHFTESLRRRRTRPTESGGRWGPLIQEGSEATFPLHRPSAHTPTPQTRFTQKQGRSRVLAPQRLLAAWEAFQRHLGMLSGKPRKHLEAAGPCLQKLSLKASSCSVSSWHLHPLEFPGDPVDPTWSGRVPGAFRGGI